jgi:hypothetical protein
MIFLPSSRLQKLATLGAIGNVVFAVFDRHSTLLFDLNSGPHLVAQGFGFIAEIGPWFTLLLSWTLAITLISCIWTVVTDQSIERTARVLLVSGALALLLQFLTVDKRLVFNYFPSIALMAIGLSFRVRSHFPLLMLVVSLYFSAATHKLVNFPNLLTYIPDTIAARLPERLIEIAPGFAEWLPRALSVIVIPLEYTMAICLLLPRTRMLGFALAFSFHTLVSSFTNGADALSLVGFFVLYAHGMQFLFFASQPIEVGKPLMAAALGLAAWLATTNSNLVGLKNAVMLYLPIGVIVLSILIQKQERDRLQAWAPDLSLESRREKWVWLWGGFLLVWSAYPALIGYRNQQYGWAMMSGAHLGRPVACIKAQPSACFDRWYFEPQVKVLRIQDEVVFASGQHSHIEQVRRHLMKRCGIEASAVGRLHIGDSGRTCTESRL